MSSISRLLPETYDTRLEALELAQSKLDSIPPASNPLTAATTARLAASRTDFSTKFNAILAAAFAYNSNTPIKDSTKDVCTLFTSHFIQVFNLGVRRAVYTAAQRDFFNLPIGSDAVPELKRSVDVLLWANAVVNGDPNRVTAGGAPMVNPTKAELQTRLNAFYTAFTNQSNLKDALDLAQEALEGIIEETDKVIKKVWDELETFYNEESDESRRSNCREWGVAYITVGNEKTMSGTVTYNGTPAVGFVVRFINGKLKSTTDATGAYSLTTRMMGTQEVTIIKLDENNIEVKRWQFRVELNESGDLLKNFAVTD